MSLFFTLSLLIFILILLIAKFKISPFLSLLLVAIFAGFLLGIPMQNVAKSVQKGIGEMLGGIVILLSAGAMIGKLVAESGAAKVISDKMMSVFGEKYMQLGLMLTGLLVGIPLFYNVGFVIVLPIIFSLVQQYRMSVVYVAIPILASLSVAHSLLPPHPSPASLVITFQANMATTFGYGLLVAIPAILVAGSIFSKFIAHIQSEKEIVFVNENIENQSLPSLSNSIFSAILPVFLLASASILSYFFASQNTIHTILNFINEPSVLMLIALLSVTYSLGIAQGKSISTLMKIYEEAIKDIAMILLIIGASGALKQVMIDSNLSVTIASFFQNTSMNPLLLGWMIAALIRVSIGSATVAGLTAAGIIAPMMSSLAINPNLMVLAIGAGSIFCSHVNDTGFWMFKEYFNLSIKNTFLTWTIMESIVSVMGLLGVLIISFLI